MKSVVFFLVGQDFEENAQTISIGGCAYGKFAHIVKNASPSDEKSCAYGKKNAQSTPRLCKFSKFAQPVQNLHMHMHSPHDMSIGGKKAVHMYWYTWQACVRTWQTGSPPFDVIYTV